MEQQEEQDTQLCSKVKIMTACKCNFHSANGVGLREHTHKKLLKSGHCPEGGGGFRACPNCLEHFFKIWAFLKKGGGGCRAAQIGIFLFLEFILP